MLGCILRHLHHLLATSGCTVVRWDCMRAMSVRQNIEERSWGWTENNSATVTHELVTECMETWLGSLASLVVDSTPEKIPATCPTRSAPMARMRGRQESCHCPSPATMPHTQPEDCPPPKVSFPVSLRLRETPPNQRTYRLRHQQPQQRRPSYPRPCSSGSRFRTCTFPCLAEDRMRQCPSSATAP